VSKRHPWYAAICLLALSGAPLCAQGDSDDAQHAERCRFAAQVVTTGRPAPHEQWALGYIGGCGTVGGSAIATLLSSTESSPDSALLDRVLNDSHLLQDGELYRVEVDLLSSGTAPVVVRLLAARSLGYLLIPGAQPALRAYAASGSADLPRACTVGASVVHPSTPVPGAPLPTDYRQQIRSAALAIRADSSQPRDVRAAAYCLDLGTRETGAGR